MEDLKDQEVLWLCCRLMMKEIKYECLYTIFIFNLSETVAKILPPGVRADTIRGKRKRVIRVKSCFKFGLMAREHEAEMRLVKNFPNFTSLLLHSFLWLPWQFHHRCLPSSLFHMNSDWKIGMLVLLNIDWHIRGRS